MGQTLSSTVFEQAAHALLAANPRKETARELMKHRLQVVRGRAILDCWPTSRRRGRWRPWRRKHRLPWIFERRNEDDQLQNSVWRRSREVRGVRRTDPHSIAASRGCNLPLHLLSILLDGRGIIVSAIDHPEEEGFILCRIVTFAYSRRSCC